jgi:DNA adenine methylase
MERYNAKGEFNVPFGHYKKFSCSLSAEHHEFLSEVCKVKNKSFERVFDEVEDTDFVFVDPPYLERLGYTQGDGGLALHEGLSQCLKATNAKWMVIHSDNEFYRDCYSEFCIRERDFAYAQRFGKGKDHSGAKVKHLYITNY